MLNALKMECKNCKLDIGYFLDYFGFKWYGCECLAKLTKEEYEKEMGKRK